MKKFEVILSCTLFFILAIISSHKLIFSPGIIIHHDWSIPPYQTQITQDFPSDFFSAWNRGIDVAILSRGAFIIGLVNRLLSLIFSINGEQLSKMYLILTIWFSGFFMYYVNRRIRKSMFSSVLIGIFYALSPWLFNRIVAGALTHMLAYTLYPLCFYFFNKSVDSSNRNILVYSLLVGMLSLLIDGIFFVIFFGSLILYSIISIILSIAHKEKEIFIYVRSLTIIFCFFFLTNLYWIIPAFFLPQDSNLYLATVDEFIDRSKNAQMINVIRGLGSPIEWFLEVVRKNFFFYLFWNIVSFSIPLIAFSALLFNSKSKNVIFFSLLSIISMFFGKGVNQPLGNVNLLIYENIIYMQIFRDPNKLIILLPFTYSFLLLENIELIYSKNFRIKCCSFSKIKNFMQVNDKKLCLIVLFLISLNAIFSYPFLTGNFGGLLKTVNFPESYQIVTQWLEEQKGDFRVLWLPPDLYTQYNWVCSQSYQQRDIMASYSPKPNLMVYSSSPIGYLSYFIASSLYHNETCYLSEILATLGVKYIIMRNDAEGWWWRNFGWSREKLSYIIKNQIGLKLVKRIGMIDIYENELYESHQKFFITNGAMLISGGLSSFISMTYLPNKCMLKNPLVLMEQIPSDNVYLWANYADKIFIKDGNFLDLVFGFVPKKYVIDLSKYATRSDKMLGWAKLYDSYYFWLNPYYLDSAKEVAVTSTDIPLNVKFLSEKPGKYELYIKSFFNPKLSLVIEIDGIKIGEINSSMFDTLGYSWIKVNSIYLTSGIHEISICNNNKINGEILVSQLAIVPEEIMEKATLNAVNMSIDKNIMYVFEAEMVRWDLSESWVLNGSFGLNASRGLALSSKISSSLLFKIFTLKPDIYEISVRAKAIQPSKVGFLIDDSNIYELSLNESDDFLWFETAKIYLSSGQHILSLVTDGNISIDLLVLKSACYQEDTSSHYEIPYFKISPTKYVINVKDLKSQNDLFLIFREPYSNVWEVSVNGREINSIPAYSGFNSFIINDVEGIKEKQIIIEYRNQFYFEAGLYIYLITFLTVVIFYVYKICTIVDRKRQKDKYYE
ncbi:MAG: hypothetical protein QXE05_01090 [Nitrososphaeria archaeon]